MNLVVLLDIGWRAPRLLEVAVLLVSFVHPCMTACIVFVLSIRKLCGSVLVGAFEAASPATTRTDPPSLSVDSTEKMQAESLLQFYKHKFNASRQKGAHHVKEFVPHTSVLRLPG
mgnify:FL=1